MRKSKIKEMIQELLESERALYNHLFEQRRFMELPVVESRIKAYRKALGLFDD